MIDFLLVSTCFVAASYLIRYASTKTSSLQRIFYGWLSLGPTVWLHYSCLFLVGLAISGSIIVPFWQSLSNMKMIVVHSPLFIIKAMLLSFVLGAAIVYYIFIKYRNWTDSQFVLYDNPLFNFQLDLDDRDEEEMSSKIAETKREIDRLHVHEVSVIVMMSFYFAISFSLPFYG